MAQLPVECGGAENFTAFFGRWVDHHEALFDQLLPILNPRQAQPSTNDSDLAPIINQVLLHYHRYFDEVSKLASEDIFILFSAPWLSHFERAFQWIGDFRPTLVFRLVGRCDLTGDQARDVEKLRAKTRRKESELEEAMAGIQESMAAPPPLGLLQQRSRSSAPLVNGEVSDQEVAMVQLREAMRVVVEDANALRGATVRGLMEVLRPVQTIRSLVAASEFQLRARRWGL